MKKLLKSLGAVCLALGAFANPALAWEPEKPIEIVVGFSAGGGTDRIARTLAAAAKDEFPYR